VNHRRIDGKDGVAGSIPAESCTLKKQQARPDARLGMLYAGEG
jgi:hypothetical protein